ncbi:MAG: class II fructose-bisphosphate aldolase [Clostridia bacterium]|nr:class II fructose-bisphosphate aldolase [Clostridia bacterium]
MLVTMREILDDAKKRRYGVGMFNTFNIEMALGVLSAAEEMKAPVIIGTAEALLDCCDLELAAQFIGFLAKRSTVPVALHLDHGFTDEVVRRAIDSGFTSVMLDCSEAPYEENVQRLKAMSEYAHKKGASVEGELGHVVFDTAEDTGYVYTKPEQARDFVERTNVDALAIAIGTAHGVYKEKPVLDLERLRRIRAATDAGLVLHGGSGLSDDDFRNVVRDGIQKINIYTDVSFAMTRAARDYVEKHSPKAEEVSPAMREAAKRAAIAKLELFGCAGKA